MRVDCPAASAPPWHFVCLLTLPFRRPPAATLTSAVRPLTLVIGAVAKKKKKKTGARDLASPPWPDSSPCFFPAHAAGRRADNPRSPSPASSIFRRHTGTRGYFDFSSRPPTLLQARRPYKLISASLRPGVQVNDFRERRKTGTDDVASELSCTSIPGYL